MSQLIDQWQKEAQRQNECSDLVSKYELYSQKLFCEYEPLATAGQNVPKNFFCRLDAWLQNYSSDQDRWSAFQLVDDIFFVGKNEVTELYRVAYDQIATDWLIGIYNLSYTDDSLEEKLQQAFNETWFCPITDSLRINAFRHINHISLPDHFPDWRSLAEFGDTKKIQAYVAKTKTKQLVLIEDVIGSGNQAKPAIKFAASCLDIPILVIPLMIGKTGHKQLTDLKEEIGSRLSYEPVIVLSESCSVTSEQFAGEPLAAERNRQLVSAYRAITDDAKPFGYEQEHGYLLVTHANCPNNTIKPIYSEQSWVPLFPRSSRWRQNWKRT